MTFKGPAVRVAPRLRTEVIGTLTAKSVAGATPIPGLVTHPYGKGRTCNLAAGFDAAFSLYASPYERLILADAIRWAASAPQPVAVEAPMCVHSTVMRQQSRGGERLVVHLFNDQNTTAFHAPPADTSPFARESSRSTTSGSASATMIDPAASTWSPRAATWRSAERPKARRPS